MDHKTNKISNDSEIIKSVNRSLELLKIGNLQDALFSFEEILKFHYSDLIAESGIKCCKFWIPRIHRFSSVEDGLQKGKLLIEEWNKFEVFIQSIKNIQQKVVNQLMCFIYNEALVSFKKDLINNKIVDIETLFIVAKAYKKMGDYQNSISYFEKIIECDRNNSQVLAELADCYALIDEIKKAKILFREAFFIDPSSIDIKSLESELIQKIIQKTIDNRISKGDLNYWIPVYAKVFNIFNIYRDLLPIEFGKLKQEIFYLEKNFNLSEDGFYKARLLNCYFWLYDYYQIKKSDYKDLVDIENKIKNISIEIYSIFKNQFYHTGD